MVLKLRKSTDVPCNSTNTDTKQKEVKQIQANDIFLKTLLLELNQNKGQS